jgi:phage protein D
MVNSIPLVAARPAILVSGSDQGVSTNLLNLTVEEAISGPARCEIILNNWSSTASVGFLYLDRAIIDFSKDIEVLFSNIPIFKGRISAIEAIFPEDLPPQLLISAEDRMQDLGRSPNSRIFNDVTLTDVFAAIAGDHGLAAELDFHGPHLSIVAQLNESDLTFITRLSEQYNLRVRVFDRTLTVRSRQGIGSAINLTLGRNLRSFRVQADLAEQHSRLTVSGWNVRAKETIHQETTDVIIQSELNGGDGGASILRSAFGDYKELLSVEQTDDEQAMALSQAAFLQQARRFVTGSGITDGNPKLRAGGFVKISNLGGNMFDGRYALAHVCHCFDHTSGYTTDIETFRAEIGRI